ncbi:MAG: RND transporter [Oceanospirillaceae bacterium]|nr:RND transporter [Oceanospirillaceae bacterium]|tara:strand:- start:35740 stop:38061 length:2322 start_codon:yes stop_codon:yes gene_type:complete
MRDRYFDFIQRHPLLILICSVLFVVAATSGVTRLSFTSDLRAYFSEQNPQLRAFEDMEQRFSKQDSLLFLVSSETQNLFSPTGLELVERLTDTGWTLPHVQRVDSLQNYQYTTVDGDDLDIDSMYRADELPDDLPALMQKALGERDIPNRLLSEDGQVTSVLLTLNLPDHRTSEATREAVYAAREMLAEVRPQYPDYLIELGGSATSNLTMAEAIQKDIESLLIYAYAVMLVIMLLMLRTFSGVVLTSALIGLSVSTTMGIFGWLGYQLTPPTGFVPTAIMTIAVADTIHILVSYYFNLQQGQSREDALKGSLRINFSPVFITSVTTMIGVLSLNTSDSPPYRDMGNMIAVGVMIAWGLSMTLLPAVIRLLPPPGHYRKEEKPTPWIDSFANLIIRRHKPLFLALLGVVVLCASFIPRNNLTESWHAFYDDTFEIRRTIDHIDETLKSLHALYFIADSGISDGVNQVAFLQQLDGFTEWLRAQPEVVQVTALSDTLKNLNQQLHADDPEWYRVPDSADAAAQYLLLYELSLPLGLGLETTMTSDRSATRLQATLSRTDSAHILQIEDRAVAWAAENAPLLNIQEATGLDIVFANLTYRNTRAMIEGTAMALVVITLVMIAVLRSPRMGLISMIPNVFPAIMSYGLWGLISGHVDTATSVVACLSLGIVVDDTVHFLSKYNHARTDLGKSTEDAIRYAFRTVGVALLITSAILVGGFAVMEFSHFMPSRSMGLLLALTIFVALLIDFLLLPPLLLLTDKRKTLKATETAEPGLG